MLTTTAARRDWAAVVSLGLGVFTITTTEIMPIGLLRPMADDLGVSEGSIGLTVTFFAFVAALSAPTLSTATRPVSYTHLRAHETVLDLVCLGRGQPLSLIHI